MNSQFIGTGRLGRDPELRYTKNGKAVCELGVAFQNSTKDRQSGDYVYSPTVWVSITLWERMAENAAGLLRKGDELLCSGSLELEEFERTRGDRAGEKDSKMVLKNAEVAPSIRRTAPFQRTDGRGETGSRSDIRTGSNGQGARTQARQPDPVTDRRAPLDDPFAAAGASSDPPPF
jgi:single-strand DNA-binding protein